VKEEEEDFNTEFTEGPKDTVTNHCANGGCALEVGSEAEVEVLQPSLSDGFRMTTRVFWRAKLKLTLNPHP
jgi:hypothetical protein